MLPSSNARNSQELKTKRIFQIQPGILQIIQFIHLEMHLDGAWDTFGKWHSMALSQYIKRKHLAQKFFEFHAEVKKCHFGNFSERAGMAVPCQCGPQESLAGSEKFFLFQVPINSQHCWEGKLESALFSTDQSGKKTECIMSDGPTPYNGGKCELTQWTDVMHMISFHLPLLDGVASFRPI